MRCRCKFMSRVMAVLAVLACSAIGEMGCVSSEQRSTRALSSTPESGPDMKASPVPAASAATTYTQGQISYAGQDYKQALDQFSKYLEQYPDAEDAGNAQFWKAKCLLRLDRPAEAAPEFEKVRLNYRLHYRASMATHREAMCYELLGKMERAIDLYQLTVRDYPSTPAADQAQRDISRLSNDAM